MKEHADCFANKDGICICLHNTYFRGKDCPFYATKKQAEESRRKCRARLMEMDCQGLIEKYGGMA